MTPIEAFAAVASLAIFSIVTQLRCDGETDRPTDGADYVTGAIVLVLTWLVSVALDWMV